MLHKDYVQKVIPMTDREHQKTRMNKTNDKLVQPKKKFQKVSNIISFPRNLDTKIKPTTAVDVNNCKDQHIIDIKTNNIQNKYHCEIPRASVETKYYHKKTKIFDRGN